MDFYEFEEVSEGRGVPEVDPVEVHNNLGKIKVIDVRTEDEFIGELGHIENAIHVPLDTLPEVLGEIPNDASLVFVCRSGGRSAHATEFALAKGYHHVYNMRGGMMLWNNLGLRTE